MSDDQAARNARAQDLRRQIARIKERQGGSAESSTSEDKSESCEDKSHTKSPREFIHERMRELDKEGQK